MAGSPLSDLLNTLVTLDVDAVMAKFAADCELLRTDGRLADGSDEVRSAVSDFLAPLRSITHSTSNEWNPEDGVWIAELEATYELKDGERHGPYPRMVLVRSGDGGVTALRFYGSHELPLTAHRPYREVRAGSHWLPTL